MRTYNLDILEFVRTGNFSDLNFGLSKKDLISMDLIPDAWGGPEAENRDLADIWTFGNIEFYFDKENLFNLIWCDSVSFKIQGNDNIIITNYWLLKRKKITLSKTISELLKLNLDFDKKFIQPGFIEITLKNGVYFTFDFVNNELDPHNIWTMTAIGKRNVNE